MPKTVRIVKNWDYPDLLRQSPNHEGKWGDFHFRLDNVHESDYLIVLNWGKQPTDVYCPPEHVWALMQEPPADEYFKRLAGTRSYARIYTTDPHRQGYRYFHSQTALPWHIHKSYDQLKQLALPIKNRIISSITSSKTKRIGHRNRFAFIEFLRMRLDFDLYGKGYHFIEDKWDGLAPYKYSIVIENHSTSHYWSEKIADCFLGWTMPIYFGCTNITDYFPPESLVQIDISQPSQALEKIQSAIADNLWEKNFDALCESRSRILDEHQFFPFICKQIEKHELDGCDHQNKELVVRHRSKPPFRIRAHRRITQVWNQLFPKK
jgi:hypothetical protein